MTRRAQLGAFHAWLLGTAPQRTAGGRAFRTATAWCWNIDVPAPAATGEVHQAVMLDGTYLQDWCVLIAYDGRHVIGWQWCDREKTIAWRVLLESLPAPDVAIIDGGTGLRSALAQAWPDTRVQRCYFHITTGMTRHLTRAPRLPAGRELATLTRALMQVRDLDQAAAWLGQYATWEARWDAFLRHRTYPGSHRERPIGIAADRPWWYTHRDLRRARALIRSLIRDDALFTWLTHEHALLPRTTSPLEGGPNRAIKELLRAHRGMPSEHARRAVDWLLNSLTEHPHDPWSLARPEHWQPPAPTPPLEPEPGPAHGYDTHFSWEDGNGIQTGWAGRHHP